MSVRALGKFWAHRSGALGAYHALRHAETLTVLMFHRVLPDQECMRLGADPLYTVSPQFLSDCVSFLQKHYTIVTLEDVLQSLLRSKPLPPAAALITFDDGWYDNLAYGLPAMGATPWTIFVATDALAEPGCWWQEALLWAVRGHHADLGELRREAGCGVTAQGENEDEIYSLLKCYAGLPSAKRASILSPYSNMICQALEGQPMMLKPEDLNFLKAVGVSIGGHGASHLPLSLIPAAADDLQRAHSTLAEWAGPPEPFSMSFPHGRYNSAAAIAARDLGYRLLFTSDPGLNRCEKGWLQGDLLGRIPVDTQHVTDENGKMCPHKLAAWLFLREIRSPNDGHQ